MLKGGKKVGWEGRERGKEIIYLMELKTKNNNKREKDKVRKYTDKRNDENFKTKKFPNEKTKTTKLAQIIQPNCTVFIKCWMLNIFSSNSNLRDSVLLVFSCYSIFSS
jgi:hypothetical protein